METLFFRMNYNQKLIIWAFYYFTIFRASSETLDNLMGKFSARGGNNQLMEMSRAKKRTGFFGKIFGMFKRKSEACEASKKPFKSIVTHRKEQEGIDSSVSDAKRYPNVPFPDKGGSEVDSRGNKSQSIDVSISESQPIRSISPQFLTSVCPSICANVPRHAIYINNKKLLPTDNQVGKTHNCQPILIPSTSPTVPPVRFRPEIGACMDSPPSKLWIANNSLYENTRRDDENRPITKPNTHLNEKEPTYVDMSEVRRGRPLINLSREKSDSSDSSSLQEPDIREDCHKMRTINTADHSLQYSPKTPNIRLYNRSISNPNSLRPQEPLPESSNSYPKYYENKKQVTSYGCCEGLTSSENICQIYSTSRKVLIGSGACTHDHKICPCKDCEIIKTTSNTSALDISLFNLSEETELKYRELSLEGMCLDKKGVRPPNNTPTPVNKNQGEVDCDSNTRSNRYKIRNNHGNRMDDQGKITRSLDYYRSNSSGLQRNSTRESVNLIFDLEGSQKIIIGFSNENANLTIGGTTIQYIGPATDIDSVQCHDTRCGLTRVGHSPDSSLHYSDSNSPRFYSCAPVKNQQYNITSMKSPSGLNQENSCDNDFCKNIPHESTLVGPFPNSNN